MRTNAYAAKEPTMTQNIVEKNEINIELKYAEATSAMSSTMKFFQAWSDGVKSTQGI